MQSSRSGSDTSCKRPLASMTSSGTQHGFGAQMVYPEKGSVYFQSCRVRDVPKTLTRTNSMSSVDNESDTESRLTDLEDELNRAWELGLKTQRPLQQHDLQCFTSAKAFPQRSFNETAF